MREQRAPRKSALAVVFTLIFLVAAACGSSGPTDRSFSIEFADGEPKGGVKTFTANQGDNVTIQISTDAAGTFHLHGYDFEAELEPGDEDFMELVADATGRFAIEIEELEQDVAFLEIQP